MEGTLSLSPLLEDGGGSAPASPRLPGGTLSRGEIELARHLGGLQQQQRESDAVSCGWQLDRGLGATNFSKCYLCYCMLCCLLTSTLLVAVAWEALAPRREARFWQRRLRPWEESVEAFVGCALCTETLLLLHVMGRRTYFGSCWRRLDAAAACLTLVCGAFFVLRRAAHGAEEVVEGIDVPMLTLRFALQPFRMFSTASMVVRAHRIHQVTAQVVAEPVPLPDPRKPYEGLARPALTPELAAEVRELLPCYLRFSEWELLYSPTVHGTSLNTFYRRQAGPNLVVCRDAHGGLFGGFAADSWRPTSGSYGQPDSFIFVVREPNKNGKDAGTRVGGTSAGPPPEPSAVQTDRQLEGLDGAGVTLVEMTAGPQDNEESSTRCSSQSSMPQESEKAHVEVFWAIPKVGNLLQWSDSKMFGLGTAMVVRDDFLRGSSCECKTFGSPRLSPAGEEFVIRDFECWQIGSST